MRRSLLICNFGFCFGLLPGAKMLYTAASGMQASCQIDGFQPGTLKFPVRRKIG